MATKHSRKTWIITAGIAVAIAGFAGGFVYWQTNAARLSVDTSSIVAPEIDLAPSQPGILEEVYVQVGDQVNDNATVARVGNELIKAKVSGIIIAINEKIGEAANPGSAVVSMIDPTQLRVVGKVDEDKGLNRIQVGDAVTFTVDAFGGKQFSGVIDEIAPTSNQSGIVFNISNQRAVQQFDVKARFDTGAYPELKNGMSARMKVYTQ